MASRPAAGAWTGAPNEAAGQAWGEQLNTFVGQLPGGDPEESLTLNSDSITPTQSAVAVEVQSGTTDDLAHMGTANLPAGSIVTLRLLTAGRVITIKNGAGGAGQILTYSGTDILLNDIKSRVSFILNGSGYWEEIRHAQEVYKDEVITFTEVLASPRVVLLAESGRFFKSDPAAAAQNVAALPPATVVGTRVRFGSDSTFGFKTVANGTDTIQRGTATSSAGGNYAVAADGTVVSLLVWKTGQWIVETEFGTAGAVA